MFSYFGGNQGSDEGQKAVETEQPQTLEQIDAREQARLIQAVDANVYVRRSGNWQFRNGLGLRDFIARCVTLGVLFGIAFFSSTKTPRGREDRKWLIDFTMVMLIWFAAVHTLAYAPSKLFGGFKELSSALLGRVQHAYSNWRDYQYAAFIIVMIVVLYPFILFFYLMYDGFDPYDNLTAAQKRQDTGLDARICYIFRLILHTFMIVVTVYFFVTMFLFSVIRSRTSYAGQYVWIAKLISRMPYGAMFFQPGEYYDCAICLEGIWSGANVVRLTCGGDDKCVFHADCLRQQLVAGNAYCVCCEQPIVVQNPPPAEAITEETP